jgi:hypothetical protein
VLQRRPPNTSASVGSHKSTLQLLGVQAPSHIQQRPLDRCDRYSLLLGDVMIGKISGLMQTNFRPMLTGPSRLTQHLDRPP